MVKDIHLTPEDEEAYIEMFAKNIHKHGLENIAIIMIESFKPMSFIGANMGRLFFSPFLPAINNNAAIGGEKLFQLLENTKNADKLLKAIDKISKESEEKKRIEKTKNLEEKDQEPRKKWWKRIIH